MSSLSSNSHLSSALRFLGAVGLSYSVIFGLSSLAAFKQKQLINKNKTTKTSNTEDDDENHKLCKFCLAQLEEISTENNNNNQLQLQIAVLKRLLKDRNMISSSTSPSENDETNSSSSFGCTCSPSLPNIPLPLLSLDSTKTTFTSLQTPTKFFETLLEKIASAEKRIIISSLYIGSGNRSQQLIDALTNKLSSNPEIELLIVLDFCRMQCGNNMLAIRPIVEKICENNSRIDDDAENQNNNNEDDDEYTAKKRRRVKQREHQQRVSLFCSPSSIGQMVGRRFGRAREAQGVQHTKLLVFDDDVILTGANLSDDYFLDRMDRFILVEHNNDNQDESSSSSSSSSWISATLSSPLAEHVVLLAKTLASTSLNLVTTTASNNNNNPSSQDDRKKDERSSRSCCNGTMKMMPNLYNIDPDLQHGKYVKVCESAMQSFERSTSMSFNNWLLRLQSQAASYNNGADNSNNNKKTFIIPSQQFARAGVFTDMSVMETILSFEVNNNNKDKDSKASSSSTTTIQRVIASPYLNTHDAFIDKMFEVCKNFFLANNNNNKEQKITINNIKNPKLFRFVTCSPQSNAWNGSRGLAGGLPQLYYSLVRSFYFLAEDFGFSDIIQIREFEKLHIVNRFGEPTGEEIPDGVSLGVFSPYMRPDAEDEAEEEKEKNKNKAGGYFPRSSSSAERFDNDGDEDQNKDDEESSIKRVANATFHAKGVWIATVPSHNNNDQQEIPAKKKKASSSSFTTSTLSAMSSEYDSEPFATVIGSNNLGERCVYKDVESDYLVITSDKKVQRTLSDEVVAILKHSAPVSRESFLTNSDCQLGRFQPVVEVVGSLMSSYL